MIQPRFSPLVCPSPSPPHLETLLKQIQFQIQFQYQHSGVFTRECLHYLCIGRLINITLNLSYLYYAIVTVLAVSLNDAKLLTRIIKKIIKHQAQISTRIFNHIIKIFQGGVFLKVTIY